MNPLFQRSFVLSLARHEKLLEASATMLEQFKTALERPAPENTEGKGPMFASMDVLSG